MSSRHTFVGQRPVRKVLLYSHDTYGLGHIRRNLAIAQHLLAIRPNLQVVLASGSAMGSRFDLPRGVSLVGLPPVVKAGPDTYRPLDSRLTLGLVRRARTAVITDAVQRLRPDVMLVDHAPAGMGGELREVFQALAPSARSTRLVLGLRDVLDEPETVARTWADEGIYDLLDDVYDEIYVYGQREMFDVGAAYRLSPEAAARLRYTGYIDRSRLARETAGVGPREPFLLATAGGGGDGAEVLTAALEVGARLRLETLIVTGPLMDPSHRAALDARAAGTPGARVVSFHPAMGALMRAASVVVTMGGYNSMAEAAASGTPTIVVPRTWPRREQMIRAELFAARGLVDIVAQGPGLADRLSAAVSGLLRSDDGARFRRELNLGGLDELARFLLRTAVERAPEQLEVQAAA